MVITSGKRFKVVMGSNRSAVLTLRIPHTGSILCCLLFRPRKIQDRSLPVYARVTLFESLLVTGRPEAQAVPPGTMAPSCRWF